MEILSWLAAPLTLVLVTGAVGMPQVTAPHADPAEKLVSEFRAEGWTTRASAFDDIRSPKLLTSAQQKQLLTEVLERENGEVDRAFREGIGTSKKYGESHGEYHARLGSYLLSLVLPADISALVALSNMPYHHNSVLARRLATYGEILVPAALQLAVSDIGPKRWQAFGLAGGILQLAKRGEVLAPLAPSSKLRLNQLLIAGTRDPDMTNREIAVHNMGVAANPAFLPVLTSLAKTDPGVMTHRGFVEYPVREEARTAIGRIKAEMP